MTNSSEILKFLSIYDVKVYELAVKLRELLFKTLPNIQEELDLSARIIGYGYGPKYADTICTMILSKKGLKLGFYKGTKLPDPKKILQGSGKVHKYVEIKSEADIGSAVLKKLLADALKAYEERKNKGL